MAASQPGMTLLPPSRRRAALRGVPVFMYHGVAEGVTASVDERDRRYFVPLRTFEQHLAVIGDTSFHPATLDALCGASTSPAQLANAVVLTFDDGRASDYTHAFPRLRHAGVPGHFFVNTALIGRAGFLDWRQMREMAAAGMVIGSHGCDHLDMSALGGRRLREQLAGSKQVLEDGLSLPVRYFAAPYGSVSPAVIAAAREAGYLAICTSRHLPARPGAITVSRIAVYSDTSAEIFQRLLFGQLSAFSGRLMRSALLWAPKQVLRGVRALQLSTASRGARETRV